MEQEPARRISAPALARPAAERSMVDWLFAMPEGAAVKRASREQKANAARLEAQLAAGMRSLIAARLRGEAG